MRNKTTENIPFTNDLMFSLVMRDEDICRDFLQMILPEEDFGEIRLMRSDNPLIEDEPVKVETQSTLRFEPNAHGVRFDAYAKARNVWAEIEMQTYKGEHIAKRARYYQANMDMDALEQGKPYRKLPRAYVIFICTYDYIGQDEAIYVFRTADEKGLILNDETYKIIINTACSPEKIPENLKSFFSYIIAPDTAHRSALVEKIDTRVRKFNTSEWRQKQMTLQELMDREHEIGHEEGFALGVEQGIEQGIESVIAVYREFNVSEDDAKTKIKNSFSINEEMIEVYFKKYWK